MGEARRRIQPHGFRPNPVKDAPRQHHVLALIDRRIETNAETNEIEISDKSAKPGRYASADLRHLYQWDGKMLRHLDRRTLNAQTDTAK
jgi:hypothetical protein